MTGQATPTVNKRDTMNSTASEGRSAAASAVQPEIRLQPGIVRHVLTAVDIEGTMLTGITSSTTSLAIQPRSVLALLVYHYARGMLASHDIESTLRKDARLRLLCRDELPDWRQLRRFRRLHHGLVSNCLAHVLAEEGAPAAPRSSASTEAEQRLREAAVLEELFADE